MKIFKVIFNIIKVAIPICCLASCNYLNVVPPETEDLPDLVKDEPTCRRFALSNYEGCWYHFYYNRIDCSTDEFVYPQIYNRDDQRLAWNELDPTKGLLDNWSRLYQDLGQIHLFQRLLSKYRPSDVTDDEYNRWMAEMVFLQAYYHFLLLEDYGPIPISDRWFGENTVASELPGRSHFDCCVDSIVSWCDQAAKALPAIVDVNETGRATSVACKALKARVLLYAASPLWNGSFPYSNWRNKNYETPGYGKELVSHTYDPKKWQRALEACNDAITWATTQGERTLFNLATSESIRKNENVPLPTIDNVDSAFKERVMLMRYLTTTTEDDGNKEIILGVIPSTSELDVYKCALPHGVTTYNGTPTGGYSGMSPYLFTVEYFYTINGLLPQSDPDFYPQSEWFNSAGLSNHNIIKLNANREPRFYAWLGFDGGEYSSFLSNGSPLVIQSRVSSQQGYNPDRYNRDNNVTGYLSKKGIQPNIKWRSTDNGQNIRIVPNIIIRLAELYLDRAECYAALGETDMALADLNVIRERAGIPDLTTTDVSSKMTLMDWVCNERFVELWNENQRYFDLRRWCLAPEYLKAGTRMGLNAMEKEDPSFTEFNTPTKVNQSFQWANRMYLLPIASSELYSNPQLVQAPGY